jgi:chromosome segregation ATPase
MNLYKNAFENYTEKITEIEGYNKKLLPQEQQPQEELKLKLNEKKEELNKKNKELEEKVNDSNIYREQIKSKKKDLKDFNSNNDDKLRELNKDIYKNMLKIGDKKTGDAITAIKGKKKELLDNKEKIKKGLSELKSKENEARSAIKNIGADMKNNFISNLGNKLQDMEKIKKLGNIVNNNIGDKIGDKIGNIIDKVKI